MLLMLAWAIGGVFSEEIKVASRGSREMECFDSMYCL